jgi:carotenoid cleavage dioxygenase-like enzyme
MYHTIPNLFTDVREACPVRFRLDPSQPTKVERQELAPQLFPDFPALDTRSPTQPYNDFWMLSMDAPKAPGRKFFNQLLHLTWHDDASDVYRAPETCYLGGEPVFIGHPENANTGVILCQVFDAERMRGAFALFDAFHVNRGPIAVLHLREPIPLLFHACFQRR